MISKGHLAAAVVALGMSSLVAEAQQNLPRPIVLYRPMANPVQPSRGQATFATQSATTRDTTSPGKQSSNAAVAKPMMIVSPPATSRQLTNGSKTTGVINGTGVKNPAIQQASPGNQQAQSDPGQAGQAANGTKTPEQEWAEQQTRPTNQMLQNPSGAQGMTHSGFSSNQQMAPNTYFGQQFQNWTNQQAVSQMGGGSGEMSRFQPGQFGGYVAPNTYVGSGFSSWNNLSQGSISPGATGSWGMSVWP